MPVLLPLLLAAALPSTAASEGTIRISGSPADAALIHALEAGFRSGHPGATFAESLYGPESTLAGTYTGTADIAFMARELREPMERMAYQWAILEPPQQVDYAVGGTRAARPATQIGIFVNVANRIERLDLARLDAIFGAEHRRGPANARRWDAVGGSMRPIHPYGPSVEGTDALFFRRLVMKDSRKWSEAYDERADAAAALDAVAADPDGIAFAPVNLARAGVRLVALAARRGGPATLPVEASLRSGAYPLARRVSLVLGHDKGKAVPAQVQAFVSYLLSPEGQAIVARDGAYYPLDPGQAGAARAQLEAVR